MCVYHFTHTAFNSSLPLTIPKGPKSFKVDNTVLKLMAGQLKDSDLLVHGLLEGTVFGAHV
jgi:hypothetical protein